MKNLSERLKFFINSHSDFKSIREFERAIKWKNSSVNQITKRLPRFTQITLTKSVFRKRGMWCLKVIRFCNEIPEFTLGNFLFTEIKWSNLTILKKKAHHCSNALTDNSFH